MHVCFLQHCLWATLLLLQLQVLGCSSKLLHTCNVSSKVTFGAIHDAVYMAVPSAPPSLLAHCVLRVMVSSHGRSSLATATPESRAADGISHCEAVQKGSSAGVAVPMQSICTPKRLAAKAGEQLSTCAQVVSTLSVLIVAAEVHVLQSIP